MLENTSVVKFPRQTISSLLPTGAFCSIFGAVPACKRFLWCVAVKQRHKSIREKLLGMWCWIDGFFVLVGVSASAKSVSFETLYI